MEQFKNEHFLLIIENNAAPTDKRVWREATALRDTGANVTIISPTQASENKHYERIEGIDIYRYRSSFSNGSRWGYIKEYLTAFIKTFIYVHKVMLRNGKIRVIHVANPPDIFWPLAVYIKFLGIKFIFDEHDLSPETYQSLFNLRNTQTGVINRILKSFQYLSYKFSDAVISTNETYKKKAIEIYARNAGKIFVVRNGPDIRKFYSKESENGLKMGRSYLFAYIGIMAVQDGVDYIINAMNYLVNERKFIDFIVYLIGRGNDVNRLKSMVVASKLDDYFVFTGRIPDEPALKILSTADICLSPDPSNPLNDRSTMSKVMEYMALGKPIVSFDLKEARYSAQEAALYVTNNDAHAFAEGILKLINKKRIGT